MEAANSSKIGNDQVQDWFKFVQRSISTLNFGVVQIVVHNGKVVQIETTEKIRFDQSH